MHLQWSAIDGGYEASATEGTYRVVPRGDEWCLERPGPRTTRIGGFSTHAEAMAWGSDLHAARQGAPVRTAEPGWPTVADVARELGVATSVLRSWLAVHEPGSPSGPRRRLDPTTRERLRTYYATVPVAS
ncbi:hypothetical protein [Cellulosimicrobium sp. CUA-896]|uniref:hypothetical protein n=1 Tax=Cellulosimicrobium sp. CUA-896 TaxID=1517881 RepID=UPI000963B802|nr:hypothetical protein [Cellulosimicrobium sp. CUA-896]OLT48518.1 hypothetical protein BJF88_16805 [Cellulosimicrobium sp. CUA-896]